MERGITPEQRKKLEEDAASAEPYTPDDPEYDQFDGDVDFARLHATIAKEILDKNPE